MMDKRTARKVHGADFRRSIDDLRKQQLVGKIRSCTSTTTITMEKIEETPFPESREDTENMGKRDISFVKNEENVIRAEKNGDLENDDQSQQQQQEPQQAEEAKEPNNTVGGMVVVVDQTTMLNESGEKKSQFNIYVRKRPMLAHEGPKGEYDVISTLNDDTIVVHDCQMHADMKRKFISTTHHQFTKVFDHSIDTCQVYDETTSPLLHHAMQGGKSVCMMNGQTGSGKSYTMEGLQKLIARDLFDTDYKNAVKLDVSLMMLEIIGSEVYDLLNKHTKVSVCDDGKGTLALLGASKIDIESANALTSKIAKANKRRATESTTVNSVSSRSHCFCRILLFQPGKSKVFGQLTLLDLAGSERNADSSHHSPERIAETIEINKSHMALKQCIQAFMKNTTPIPYRNSMLTRLLKDCMWQADAQVSIVATISPIPTDTEHTLATLKYASMMQSDVVEIKKVKTEVENVKLKEKVKELLLKEWTHEEVVSWFSRLRNKRTKKSLSQYACNIAGGVDGKLMCRMGQKRFVLICDGNAEDGDIAYTALRLQMKASDKIEKERRQFNRRQQSA